MAGGTRLVLIFVFVIILVVSSFNVKMEEEDLRISADSARLDEFDDFIELSHTSGECCSSS